jgi:3,4-dihydroxy 2-butanone 4-phosphate synthase/GTP cyclohydrolase II
MKLLTWLSMNGMTQTQFADMVGVHPSQISRICKGQWPERKTAMAIIEATSGAVTPEDFLEGVESVRLDPGKS